MATSSSLYTQRHHAATAPRPPSCSRAHPWVNQGGSHWKRIYLTFSGRLLAPKLHQSPDAPSPSPTLPLLLWSLSSPPIPPFLHLCDPILRSGSWSHADRLLRQPCLEPDVSHLSISPFPLCVSLAFYRPPLIIHSTLPATTRPPQRTTALLASFSGRACSCFDSGARTLGAATNPSRFSTGLCLTLPNPCIPSCQRLLQ